MVPIHDTDVAEERWSQAEWVNYELWEKQEIILKRKKRIWITVTLFLFLILSAVPTVLDRWPKWETRSAIRKLAQQINQVKKKAITLHKAVRLRLMDQEGLSYVMEEVDRCDHTLSNKSDVHAVRNDRKNLSYTWLRPADAAELSIPGIVREFCYDHLTGSDPYLNGHALVGMAVIPANDLTEKRLDRMSIILLSGPSAEISFD